MDILPVAVDLAEALRSDRRLVDSDRRLVDSDYHHQSNLSDHLVVEEIVRLLFRFVGFFV